MANNSVTFKWNQSKINSLKRNIQEGLVSLGFAIANQAMRNAPVDTGALVNSIRVNEDNANTVYVLAGGNVGGRSIAYAKKREYENNLHPGTTHYMGRAYESEMKQWSKYFKGVTK